MAIKANTTRGVTSLLSTGEAGLYPSGNGLYLKISSKGAGSWIYRYQIDGKRRKMGFGSCADISLADARGFVAEQSALIARGIDPVSNREQQAIEKIKLSITMADVARDYIAEQSKGWSYNTLVNWNSVNQRYITPSIGDLLPADVTTEHVLALLQPIWESKPAQAKKLRSHVETLLDAAKVRKLRTGENVAVGRGHLHLLLSREKKTTASHHAALPWDQAAEFWQALQSDTKVSADALKLVMLTCARANEAAAAHWSEFDLKAAVWTIPAERMKTRYPHRIPLTSAMMELLDALPRLESGYLFEGYIAGKPIRAQAVRQPINRLHKRRTNIDGKGWIDTSGRKITAHGFRSTFRDWATDITNQPDRVIERCLAHSTGSQSVQAYLRTDQLERRRELMEAWNEYVTRPTASNVVQIKKAK